MHGSTTAIHNYNSPYMAKKTETVDMASRFAEFKELKNIDKTTMISVLEESFRNVLAKMFGSDENFDVIMNPDRGDCEIYQNLQVVPDGEVENASTQISLSEARTIDPECELEEDVAKPIIFADFGRRAILNLRQTLQSKILDLQKDAIYSKFKEQEGEIILGEVRQIWKREMLLLDDDQNELLMPKEEQIPGDFFHKGDMVRAIVKKVDNPNNNPKVIVSRTDERFLTRLFEHEVPEIHDGLITIKRVARIPGERAKIAVESYDDRIDPVGACVGVKGSRIHGIVRDSQGRKMSKSLGNGIDPLEVIAQYGADALRFMLVDGSTPGNDMRYIEKKVEAARNFANKLWNATRFVLMNLPEDFEPGLPSEEMLDMSDKWVLTKLNQVAGAMTDNLDHYEMGLAAAKINSFIWDVYCDWFIEIAKPRLNSGDAEQADTARRVLVYVLDKALKLLHPFMPFITEELYQALPGSAETIMTQAWPTFDAAHNWAAEEEAFEKVMDYIKAVRTMRTEMNVHPAKKTSMIIETADAAPFQNAQVYLAKFAFATDVTFTEKYEGSTDGMVQVSTHAARGFIPMMELIDREKELARLNKEKAKAEKEMAMFGNQLNNPKFVERAPAALVEEIRTKFAKSQDKLANIEQSIKALG